MPWRAQLPATRQAISASSTPPATSRTWCWRVSKVLNAVMTAQAYSSTRPTGRARGANAMASVKAKATCNEGRSLRSRFMTSASWNIAPAKPGSQQSIAGGSTGSSMKHTAATTVSSISAANNGSRLARSRNTKGAGQQHGPDGQIHDGGAGNERQAIVQRQLQRHAPRNVRRQRARAAIHHHESEREDAGQDEDIRRLRALRPRQKAG